MLHFFVFTVAGWISSGQQDLIDYLREENRVLREQLRGRRLQLTDDQGHRLATRAKVLGRAALQGLTSIVTPALPDPDEFDEAEDESTARLDGLVRPRTTFTYVYDYGDSWRHAILVEKTLDEVETPLPACLDGARACPPEDSGGPGAMRTSFKYSPVRKAMTNTPKSCASG